MKATLVGNDNYIRIENEIIVPNPKSDFLSDIEYRLRFFPTDVSKTELMYAASTLSAYREIICNKTQANRNKICSAIKSVS